MREAALHLTLDESCLAMVAAFRDSSVNLSVSPPTVVQTDISKALTHKHTHTHTHTHT